MFHNKSVGQVLKNLGVNRSIGLQRERVEKSKSLYGRNIVSPEKKTSIIKQIINALTEPMMIILLIAAAITFGVNIGKFFSGGGANFYECLGILIAIVISVSLTLIMEGRSKKAFELLNKLSNQTPVKVKRDGKIAIIDKTELVVGDIVTVESGDKIFADGRVIYSVDLKIDESMLTGESEEVKKQAEVVLSESTPLAERKNMLYSGTFVTMGEGEYVVTSVGDGAEIGKIASHLKNGLKTQAPISEKLDKLGKIISLIGGISAIFVFILSFFRLWTINKVDFLSVQDIFIESIVLLVAAVPEGLPSTMAISLSLNVVKLAKQNALIKKLVATETIGAVSVICTDKTGTLTENKMTVSCVVLQNEKTQKNLTDPFIVLNSAINSTAEIVSDKEQGSKTETALLLNLKKQKVNYRAVRDKYEIISKIPFSSSRKFMQTEINYEGQSLKLIKGAPEIILQKCDLNDQKYCKILRLIEKYQQDGKRVLAFAHAFTSKFVFDGFCVLEDNLRQGVAESIESCQNAGIKVKILTGDNVITALSIAKKLRLENSGKVLSGGEIERMTDSQLINIIDDIVIVARSTPSVKLKIVKALQSRGEVVAVTGDGVNDAPAIKHADVGVSMGDGSDITKESADLVLLDNSFSTIVQAVKFGRNVYKNFQRFITFQLTVNLSSMCIIIAFLILGMESPFSSTCLLWLNVLMDGPLALSLALENPSEKALSEKPVKRDDNLLNAKCFFQIALRGIFIAGVVTFQEIFNFMGASVTQKSTVTFATFVIFQLFNAINCREIHAKSSVSGLFSNKLLIICSVITFILQIIITEKVPAFFQTVPLGLVFWCKITLLCSSVVVFTEIYKLIYRKTRNIFLRR